MAPSSPELGSSSIPTKATKNQRFFIDDMGGGVLRLRPVHTEMVLDVQGGSVDAGAQIIQHPDKGGDNQRWEIIPA
jgi:Ricin-type beta-trefoil lectin domain-like